MIDRFLADAFGVLSCWCSAADAHLKLLDCGQWCPFSDWGVFECDIAHRRSVAVVVAVLRYAV